MIKPRILITAATGNTGFPAALQLLKQGFRVRAMVRGRSDRSSLLQAAGAEVVIGDLADHLDLTNSLSDVQRVYFCPPWSNQMLFMGATFAATVRAARLESAVIMSQWLAGPEHPSFATRQIWLLDQVIRLVPGLAVTVVNPGWFADNYMQLLGMIAQLGIMPLPLGKGLNAPPSNEDIARVIAGALANPNAYGGKSFRPTGPSLMTPEEIAETFARVLKRPVRYLDIPDWIMLKALRAIGLPEFQQDQVRHYVRDYRNNAFGVCAPTTAVHDVAGCEPEDFETIVKRYVSERSEARPSTVNWLRALANFVRIPLTPATNFRRLQTIQEQPRPKTPKLAMDSLSWIASHDDSKLVDVTELRSL